MFNILEVDLLWPAKNWFPLLMFSIGEFCALMAHEVYLGHLGVPSYLSDVSCCGLRALHFLGRLTHLAGRF